MPYLKLDITKIKEVISNMVDNAIKYTQKGGITVKTELTPSSLLPLGKGEKAADEFPSPLQGEDQGGVVRVVVSDTGIGMDEEEIYMIFEKFQRGKQVAHYHTDGTGLGMPACRQAGILEKRSSPSTKAGFGRNLKARDREANLFLNFPWYKFGKARPQRFA